MVDFIFGEEKKTSAPKYKDKIDFVSRYCHSGLDPESRGR